MEINEAIDPLQPESSNELVLTQTAQFYLTQISKWTKFLSILGFTGCGLMVLLCLAFSSMIGTFTTYQNNKAVSELFVSPWAFFYILIAIFYFSASLYLYQFGEKVKKGVLFQDASQVESGFSKLKSLFKMIGITTIVFITIYVVAIVIVMLIKPQSINYGV